MTLIARPDWFCPNGFSLTERVVQRAAASNFGGSEQVRDMMNDRWAASGSLPNRKFSDAGRVEALIGSLRGTVNTIPLYHFGRPRPQGTMRGNPTLAATGNQGADSIQVQSIAGATLQAGDMLGVGGLLLRVAADATANGSGVIAVPITNRLRRTLTNGSAVTWDKPTAPFRLAAVPPVVYIPGYVTEVAFDFIEDVTA